MIFFYILKTQTSERDYASGESLYIIVEKIKTDFLRIPMWFCENIMVLNLEKYHFMVLGDSYCTCNFTCNGTTIESSEKVKILGIMIVEI